ncbi:MAG TPA: WG repeat-containing protein [Candidatus Alistipes excrementipullorum]|nr:WG repeat-containing protein [Candidatus Alistipes excrementipullorum]
MLLTTPQYINALNDTYGLTRTLGVIDVLRDADGRPEFRVGNSSVIFRIRHEGRTCMLKCYTRPKRNLREIYGQRCLHDELYIHTDRRHGQWVDVVLDEWVEGETLQSAIARHAGDSREIGRLAAAFDRMALHLLEQEWAHGDLKPENMIVTPGGEIRLIDFDAMFRPEFAGQRSEETGTAAYQHPSRTAEYFDRTIDDYPIALISTALHAMTADASLHERFDTDEVLLISPREAVAGRSRALDEILGLFASECMAVQYRIARLLRSQSPVLFGLKELIEYGTRCSSNESGEPCLENRDGLWGYADGGKFVIPPLYDCGFDFSEGLAAVRLADCWSFIDRSGRAVIRCGRCDAVKPFRNGKATIVRNGKRYALDRTGRAGELEY